MREAGFLNFFMWAFLLLNKIFDRFWGRVREGETLLFGVFPCDTAPKTRSQKKRPSLKDGDGHDSPGAAEVVPGVGVNVVEQRCAFVCTGVEVNAEFRGLYLAADGYGPGFVNEFARVVAAYLDYLRVVVDFLVDDHEAALGCAVRENRRGVHADVDHALLDLLVETGDDLVGVGLIPAALGGRGVKLDAAVVVHGRAAAAQEQDDDGDDDDQTDADADVLVRFLLRAFAFHALPPEFLSGARISA